MNRKDVALDLFENSHNCSQAVFTAYADKARIDPDTAKAVAAGFGGGIGRTQGVCGAVTGAVMAIGVSLFDPGDLPGSKRLVGETSRAFMQKFEDREDSVECRSLIGVDLNTEEGVEEAQRKELFKTKCAKYVATACEILEEMI